jgi:hypothetical protein
MGNITLHTEASEARRFDVGEECARLEAELAERRAELSELQGRFREFKLTYARVVGGPLVELAEVEAAVRAAEARLLGAEEEEAETAGEAAQDFYAREPEAGRASLKKLFWSVARLFHPDHAADEGEAERRHSIMAEASRAYRDGDVESLNTLLGDEQLQFYCATSARDEEPQDAGTRLLNLKEELRTAEFGIKRIRQDRLYHLMLSAEQEARAGRDALAEMAGRINRKIRKARNRLEHLS